MDSLEWRRAETRVYPARFSVSRNDSHRVFSYNVCVYRTHLKLIHLQKTGAGGKALLLIHRKEAAAKKGWTCERSHLCLPAESNVVKVPARLLPGSGGRLARMRPQPRARGWPGFFHLLGEMATEDSPGLFKTPQRAESPRGWMPSAPPLQTLIPLPLPSPTGRWCPLPPSPPGGRGTSLPLLGGE